MACLMMLDHIGFGCVPGHQHFQHIDTAGMQGEDWSSTAKIQIMAKLNSQKGIPPMTIKTGTKYWTICGRIRPPKQSAHRGANNKRQCSVPH